jgi:hypothetical protein
MDSKRPVTTALRLILTPIIKLLIELGFSFRDFNEVAKLVYVDVASLNYGIKGRKTNMSRVAIMSGLTRREVARLRKVLDVDPLSLQSPNTVAGKVLAIWHQEPKYLDGQQQPVTLPVTGPGSLTELIDTIRGDIPSTAIIKELKRVHAISISGTSARALLRYYMPSALDAAAIERFGTVLYDLGTTITSNLLDAPPHGARFEGRATNDRVDIHAVKTFAQFTDQHAQLFLEQADDWLKKHEVKSALQSHTRLGIGIYAIAHDLPEDV